MKLGDFLSFFLVGIPLTVPLKGYQAQLLPKNSSIVGVTKRFSDICNILRFQLTNDLLVGVGGLLSQESYQ